MQKRGFVRLRNRFYDYPNLIPNHFSPCMHPVSRRRQGTMIVKLYDEVRPPYHKLMEHLAEGRRKEGLKAFHESLDPTELTPMVKQCRAEILLLLQRRSEIESE